MKKKSLFLIVLFTICGTLTLLLIAKNTDVPVQSRTPVQKHEPVVIAEVTEKNQKEKPKPEPKGCVFKTAFEGEGLDSAFVLKIPGRVQSSIDKALDWIKDAQLNDGGWGAGSHSRQDILDPHSVKSDPATTSMVAMSLLRSGTTLTSGQYSENLNKALYNLLEAVENSSEQSLNITEQTHTQPQSKLGQNIDVVLTSQFLTDILDETGQNAQLKSRIKKAIQKCIAKIERGHNTDGSLKGAGWAGVLQSSFASNALETAQSQGIEVNEEVLEKSKDYQMGNIDATTNSVETESAAGIVLYSVSGSARASAKEARAAKEKIAKAKSEGKILNDEVSVDNLKKAGLSESQALRYTTAYQVNKSANRLAQDENVMSGFGNNGGEEFLSYLQTGEGMIMSKDKSWKKWYDKMSARMLQIQNNNGSWSGHHCITSPVFCTATALLILSVNNDVEKLMSRSE